MLRGEAYERLHNYVCEARARCSLGKVNQGREKRHAMFAGCVSWFLAESQVLSAASFLFEQGSLTSNKTKNYILVSRFVLLLLLMYFLQYTDGRDLESNDKISTNSGIHLVQKIKIIYIKFKSHKNEWNIPDINF